MGDAGFIFSGGNLEQLNKELEEKYNRNQLGKQLRKIIEDNLHQLPETSVDKQFVIDALYQNWLFKRASLEALVGTLNNIYKDLELIVNNLETLVNDGLLVFNGGVFITQIILDPETEDEIYQYQFPPPLLTEPKKIKKNSDSPYHTVSNGWIVLRDHKVNRDVCLDHINRMNSLALVIDTSTALKGLPFLKWKEPESIAAKRTQEKTFNKFKIFLLTLLEEIGENKLYFSHKYDKRGRVYCQGYHLNYQGNDYQKYILEFANKEHFEWED